jgi:tetratricopeptide (TPR) repeat protein
VRLEQEVNVLHLARGASALILVLVLTNAASAQIAGAEGVAAGAPVSDEANQEAGERFDRGVTYFNEGDYGAALAEFLRAYELTGYWGVLYNLGQVSQGMGRKDDAMRYFQRYLAEGGAEIDAIEGRRAEVQANLDSLRGQLALLRIEVDVPGAEVLIDDEIVGTAPLADPVYLAPGPHVIVGRHPDHGSVRREVTLASDTEESVSLALAAPVGPGPGPGPGPAVEEEEGIASQWWFWTIIGEVVAGGAVTAGVLLAPSGTVWTDGLYVDLRTLE